MVNGVFVLINSNCIRGKQFNIVKVQDSRIVKVFKSEKNPKNCK